MMHREITFPLCDGPESLFSNHHRTLFDCGAGDLMQNLTDDETQAQPQTCTPAHVFLFAMINI